MNDQETMPLFAGTELTDDNGAPAEKELEKVSGLNNSSKEDSSGYEGVFNSSGTEDSQQDQPAEQDGLHLYDQIKLSKLSVYNWGSFNGGHTINIDGVGTLITGENGAGKSTIIDGLMILLSSAGKAQFNIAASQGDRSDRSLVSYMRGNFGNVSDEEGLYARTMREDSTVSVLEAVYEHTLKDEKVVLLAVFYLPGKSTALSDVKKIYAVAEDEIPVKEILESFSQSDTRTLKNYLKKYRNIRVCDDNFTEYQTCFKHRLNIQNDNAPALLSRALGLKKIDNLTSLIRNLVLEPSEVVDDIKSALKQFDDLGRTHERLVDARNQYNMLKDLPEECHKKEKIEKDIDELETAKTEIIPYVASFAARFYTDELSRTVVRINECEDICRRIRERKEQLTAEYENYALLYREKGGDGIQFIESRLNELNKQLRRVSEKYEEYSALTRELELKQVKSEEDFYDNLRRSEELKKARNDEVDAVINRLSDNKTNIYIKKNERQEIESELKSLEKHPDSNVDINFIRLREAMVVELDIPADRLVYIAELMEVKSAFSEWRGAIERALGGMRHIMLVSEEDYQTITPWVNARHNNVHVKLQIVPRVVSNDTVEFADDGFLAKINWKDHPFTDWLQTFLVKHDLTCVDSVDDLNATEFSMTREGLIHRREGFFEKNDRIKINDLRNWHLGFSNRERLEMLRGEYDKLSREMDRLTANEKKLQAENKKIQEVIGRLMQLQNFHSFTDIAVDEISAEIGKLEEQRRHILNDMDIQKYKQLYEDAKEKLSNVDNELINAGNRLYDQQNKKQDIEDKLAKSQSEIREISSAGTSILSHEVKHLKLNDSNVFLGENIRKIDNALNDQHQKLNGSLSTVCNAITRILSGFMRNERWTSITAEWDDSLEPDNIAMYLRHLQKIEKEGLPALVEEFKNKLNIEISQSVFLIQSKIDSEMQNIDNRIMKINRVLSKAEFKQNSYLRITPQKAKESPVVEKFNRAVRKVGNMLTSSDHESRFASLNDLMDILNNAISHDKQFDNRQLLDPRLRREFVAEEIDRRNGQVRDVLKSSSGKSGGEKEAFAGAVVAASLAYVLTPDNSDVPSYCTVFLDEAFSNTSDRVSERVLRIFRELKLHINLITPFKNIDIARNYARSLIVMTRNDETNDSCAHELTWEEYEDQQNKRQEEQEKRLAAEFDIQVESGVEPENTPGV